MLWVLLINGSITVVSLIVFCLTRSRKPGIVVVADVDGESAPNASGDDEADVDVDVDVDADAPAGHGDDAAHRGALLHNTTISAFRDSRRAVPRRSSSDNAHLRLHADAAGVVIDAASVDRLSAAAFGSGDSASDSAATLPPSNADAPPISAPISGIPMTTSSKRRSKRMSTTLHSSRTVILPTRDDVIDYAASYQTTAPTGKRASERAGAFASHTPTQRRRRNAMHTLRRFSTGRSRWRASPTPSSSRAAASTVISICSSRAGCSTCSSLLACSPCASRCLSISAARSMPTVCDVGRSGCRCVHARARCDARARTHSNISDDAGDQLKVWAHVVVVLLITVVIYTFVLRFRTLKRNVIDESRHRESPHCAVTVWIRNFPRAIVDQRMLRGYFDACHADLRVSHIHVQLDCRPLESLLDRRRQLREMERANPAAYKRAQIRNVRACVRACDVRTRPCLQELERIDDELRRFVHQPPTTSLGCAFVVFERPFGESCAAPPTFVWSSCRWRRCADVFGAGARATVAAQLRRLELVVGRVDVCAQRCVACRRQRRRDVVVAVVVVGSAADSVAAAA